MEIPPRPFRVSDDLRSNDLTQVDASTLRDAAYVDTSELTKPERQGLFAQVLGAVWDELSDHADDALRGLATVVRTATGKGGPATRILGGLAARLLTLAADRIEGDET